MRVVFLAPAYPPEMVQYTRGLAEVGAEIYGVADTPLRHLPSTSVAHLAGYLEVPRIMDEDDVEARVSARGSTATTPSTASSPMGAARDPGGEAARAPRGPGMSFDTVRAFRDKGIMKERASRRRAAGSSLAPREHRSETREPPPRRLASLCILKPIAGAGSAEHLPRDVDSRSTTPSSRCAASPRRAARSTSRGTSSPSTPSASRVDPVYENVAAYVPKPIEMRSFEWISPVIITVRHMDQPKLAVGLELGRKVLQALEMGDGFTHMEWFLTPSGEAVFGEIACRRLARMLVDQMNYTSDIDLFREWARVVCWQSFDAVAPRKYNAGSHLQARAGPGADHARRGAARLAARGRRVGRRCWAPPARPCRDETGRTH